MTKQELQKQLITAENEAKEWREADKSRRQTLSVILGAPQQSSFGIRETTTLTWLEISARIGGLLQKENDLFVHDEIRQIQMNISSLNKKVFDTEPLP